MRRRPLRCLAPALALALAGAGGAVAGEVTIYRCTDANGHLTLRDTPCARGQKQQAREMLRPVDPPPRPRAAATARDRTAPPATPPRPQIVVVTAPRPLYECVTADGERYTSETADGNPRWVPLATLGYPVYAYPRHRVDGPYRDGYGVGGRIEYRDDHLRGRVEFGDRPRGDGHGGPRGPRPGPPLPIAPAYPAGTWLRDTCSPLPQQEVCDRLRDRRYELDRRYNSALQSERTQITFEQRNIDARLSTDCGAY